MSSTSAKIFTAQVVPVRIDGLTVQTGARWIDEVPCGNGGCEFVCGWGGLGWSCSLPFLRQPHLTTAPYQHTHTGSSSHGLSGSYLAITPCVMLLSVIHHSLRHAPVSHSSLPAQRHTRLTLRLPDCLRMLVPVRIDGLTVQTGARWIDEVPCGNGGCEFVCRMCQF